MVIKTYVKECGDGDCHCLFVTSMVIETYVKECGDGDCHCLFVTSSGYRDLYQGVWGWRLSLFVCDL